MINDTILTSEQSKDEVTPNYSEGNPNSENRWYLMHIHSLVFFAIWLVYAVISFFALTSLTESGWGDFYLMFYGFLFHGILSLVILTIAVNKIIAKKSRVIIDIRILSILFFVQLLFLAANGKYKIVHYLGLSGTIPGSLFATITSSVGSVVMIGYLLILLFFLIDTLSDKKKMKAVTITLGAVILLGLLSSLISIPTISDGTKITTAIKNNDASNCQNISGYYTKSDCYLKIAQTTKDVTICDNIPPITNPQYKNTPPEQIRDLCYLEIVKGVVPSYEVCSKITSNQTRNECFSRIPEERACESIVDGYDNSKDACYYRLGKESRDNTYCENIASDSLKKSCYRDIDYYNKATSQ